MSEDLDPGFVSDKRFIEMNVSIPEVDQLKAMLANITRIHNLTFRKFDDFDRLIREYLETGIEVFQMETGIVSEISNEQVYHVCDVVSPIEALEKDMSFPLEDTYCREVYKSRKVIGFPEVGKIERMRAHPVYQNLKLEAYISAPIYVEGRMFGTLNFTSTQTRKFGFSENEYNLIKIMANAIGSFVSLRRKEERLVRINDQMKAFVGHVSHDLRNPIGSIIGLATLLQDKDTDPDHAKLYLEKLRETAETSLNLVESILDEAALSTGRIKLTKKKQKLSEIVEQSLREVGHFADATNNAIKSQLAFDPVLECDPKRMAQCLNNLLINAIKYSPEGSEISLHASELDGACRIEVKNRIQPASERGDMKIKALASVGFGLEIVNTILKAHQSELQVDSAGDTFSACFALAC